MTPEERARLRVDWHLAGHPDFREPEWAGLFGDMELEHDGIDEPPFQPAPDLLYLADCGLTDVPDFVFDVRDVSHLTLANQPLKHVPEGLARMQTLEALDLTFTEIEELPKAIGQLPKLEDLYLQGSKVARLPDDLFAGGLLRLTLDGTPIMALPTVGLAKLEALTLEGCGFSKVPEGLMSAVGLSQLILSNNPIARLPDEISALTRLRQLKISGCGLTSLPRSLADVPFDDNFAEGRRRGLARAIERGVPEAALAQLDRAPMPSFFGIVAEGNKFRDKSLAKAAGIKDAEARTTAIQDWCRSYGD